MAEAPGHRLGQIVGTVLEDALRPLLLQVAQEFGLYLDTKGPRRARRGKKLTWKDSLGNEHDLDFVLERGGSQDHIGAPAAFIESAWRRYTKHSRNKAQEIGGALLPLRTTYQNVRPFLGAVLAGEFTEGSLGDLRSNGFAVAHIPADAVVEAFHSSGIEVGGAEDTPDSELAAQVEKFEELPGPERVALEQAIRDSGRGALAAFVEQLRQALRRTVRRVSVTALHGTVQEFPSIADAIDAIEGYGAAPASHPLIRFEVVVVFSNGDRIQADLASPESAVEFLETFAAPVTVELDSQRDAPTHT